MVFRVGQEVVCISDDWVALAPNAPLHPVVNEVYTITSISSWIRNKSVVVFTLKEKPNDWRYVAVNFRPIVKTDISIFEAMLTPTPHKVTAS